MKVNDPVKNAERLRKQRSAKASYRKRKREQMEPPLSQSLSSTTPSSQSLTTESSQSSTTESFSSPTPQPSLAKKCEVEEPQKSYKSPPQITLKFFFIRPDITYITPGKNQQKYLGKVNGEKSDAKIRYLLWKLNDLLEILNGNKVNNVFVDEFAKKIAFRQMYEFI